MTASRACCALAASSTNARPAARPPCGTLRPSPLPRSPRTARSDQRARPYLATAAPLSAALPQQGPPCAQRAPAQLRGALTTRNNRGRGSVGPVIFASEAHAAAVQLRDAKSRGEARRAVDAALAAGVTHIDCASAYRNEGEVGARGEQWFFGQLALVGLLLAAPYVNLGPLTSSAWRGSGSLESCCSQAQKWRSHSWPGSC